MTVKCALRRKLEVGYSAAFRSLKTTNPTARSCCIDFEDGDHDDDDDDDDDDAAKAGAGDATSRASSLSSSP